MRFSCFLPLAQRLWLNRCVCKKWPLSPQDGHHQPSGMIRWYHKGLWVLANSSATWFVQFLSFGVTVPLFVLTPTGGNHERSDLDRSCSTFMMVMKSYFWAISNVLLCVWWDYGVLEFLASAWLSLVVAGMLDHLAAELISPLLLQHKVGQKSQKSLSLESGGDHHCIWPSNPSIIMMRGFCSNCYNKRILTYEVFVFFAPAQRLWLNRCVVKNGFYLQKMATINLLAWSIGPTKLCKT